MVDLFRTQNGGYQNSVRIHVRHFPSLELVITAPEATGARRPSGSGGPASKWVALMIEIGAPLFWVKDNQNEHRATV